MAGASAGGMKTRAPEPRWDLIEQHFEEAALAWPRFEAALEADDRGLAAVAGREEERLLAHVDGLVVAGEPAFSRLLGPALRGKDPARAFAAGLAACLGAPGAEPVLSALEDARGPTAAALARALELAPVDAVRARLVARLADAPEYVRDTVLAILAARGDAPGPSVSIHVSSMTTSPAPARQAAGWRACLAWSQAIEPRRLDEALRSHFWEVRAAAIEVGLLRGLAPAWRACADVVAELSPAGAVARLALAVRSGAEEVALLQSAVAAGRPAVKVHALWALGFAGTDAAVAACLAHVGDESLGRAAAESVDCIVGAGRRSGGKVDFRFRQGVRYASGQPLDGRLIEVLADATMSRRPGWAFEIALRTRGRHRVPVRALSQRQRLAEAALSGPDGLRETKDVGVYA